MTKKQPESQSKQGKEKGQGISSPDFRKENEVEVLPEQPIPDGRSEAFKKAVNDVDLNEKAEDSNGGKDFNRDIPRKSDRPVKCKNIGVF